MIEDLDSKHLITDRRNQGGDWSLNNELKQGGYINAENSLLIYNKTFLDDENYGNKLQTFVTKCNDYELPEHMEPYRIIITDSSFHFQVLVRRWI